MSEPKILREKHYKVTPFDDFLAGDEAYIDIIEDYMDGNTWWTEESVMEEIRDSVCSVDLLTENRICGVRLRETEYEDGCSLDIFIYSVQDTEHGRDILEIEAGQERVLILGRQEYELSCNGGEASVFLLGADGECCGVRAFGGRAVLYGREEEEQDLFCELSLTISWEDAEELIETLFEVEEVTM